MKCHNKTFFQTQFRFIDIDIEIVAAMATQRDAMITHVEGTEEEYAKFTHADLFLN